MIDAVLKTRWSAVLGVVAGLLVTLAAEARSVGEPPTPGPFIAHLAATDGDPAGLDTVRALFRERNPGCDVAFVRSLGRLGASSSPRVVFVQRASDETSLAVRGAQSVESSKVSVGDVVLVRPGATAATTGELDVVVFIVTEPFGDDLPVFVRPDWDPAITDTPGGCATERGAYRRICLTWLPENGPHVYHGLSAHRVRIRDSFTHYHPLEGGFDEFYLVQMVQPGARLITSRRVDLIENPERVTPEAVTDLLSSHELAVGDLVYMPRGLVHRGVGGVLAQVIAVPGFRPGMEIGVDAKLAAINAHLELVGAAALPYREASLSPLTSGRVELTDVDGAVRVTIDGELFTEVLHRDQPKPVLYPVIGPGGVLLTRGWPIAHFDLQEAHDHPHHRSLWFAHGSVNGHDFWSEQKGHGRIEHVEFLDPELRQQGILRSRNRWVAADGSVVCTDIRSLRFWEDGETRGIDYDVTLHASHGEVRLGDTKEGTMALRLTPQLRLDGKTANGRAVNSTGVTGKEVWGKRAAWVDYHGEVGGAMVGVAMFDHPANPSHPTWWHARAYGLFAANPFGVHDFEGKPAGTGDRVIAAGERLELRYRFVFHPGTPEAARIAERYRGYAAERR